MSERLPIPPERDPKIELRESIGRQLGVRLTDADSFLRRVSQAEESATEITGWEGFTVDTSKYKRRNNDESSRVELPLDGEIKIQDS